MVQFTVYRNERRSRTDVPFLLDVQSDLVVTGSRLVVPLIRADRHGPAYSRLSLAFTIEETDVIAAVPDLAAIDARLLRTAVADLSAHRDALLGALDFLVTGY